MHPRQTPWLGTRRALLSGTAKLAAGGALAATLVGRTGGSGRAQGTPAPGPGALTIRAVDFAFDAPTQIPAGLTTITLVNAGQMPHQAQFLRLHPGKTLADLQTALKQPNPAAALALVDPAGGPNAIDPGAQQTVVLDLTPGSYVLICFVSGADGVPHFAKGMIKELAVTGAAGATPAAGGPAADATVSLTEFTFTGIPATVAPGRHTWAVVDAGRQPHELQLFQLAAGITPDQAVGMLTAPPPATPLAIPATPPMATPPSGPPPLTEVGGMAALAPGLRGWVELTLTPGSYLAVCFVPDPATGKAHIEEGMHTAFTVGS